MGNSNLDLTPPEYIPLPKRASVEQWDIILIDKETASTQNRTKKQK
jgi:hypothetical protein